LTTRFVLVLPQYLKNLRSEHRQSPKRNFDFLYYKTLSKLEIYVFL
jgi:hypothetical protein